MLSDGPVPVTYKRAAQADPDEQARTEAHQLYQQLVRAQCGGGGQ